MMGRLANLRVGEVLVLPDGRAVRRVFGGFVMRGDMEAPKIELAAKYAAHHPPMVNKPGTNWVEKRGGLPKAIDAIARALVAKGWSQQRAVATAVNHVKKTCATGRAFGGKTKVSAEAQAVACRAVAQWEALKAASRKAS